MQMNKIKIAIAGLGGVGGYFGALLAKHTAHLPDINVYFVARGEHLKKIQQQGLTVIAENGTFVANPFMATDNVSEIGKVDYLIIATKSYDLDATMIQLEPCIDQHTIILPLLNGADITFRIRNLFPTNEVWFGCTYIVGRLKAPGICESTGNVHNLHFGHEKAVSEQLIFMENLMKESGIPATRFDKAFQAIWKKFFFISSSATLTSYLNTDFPSLTNVPENRELYSTLLRELNQVAEKEGIDFEEDMVEVSLKHISRLPAGATSSMNSDFLAKKQTELETLTGFVVRSAQKHHLEVPLYNKIYEELKLR